MVLMQQVEDVGHLVVPAHARQQPHLGTRERRSSNRRRPRRLDKVGGTHQQAEVLPRSQVGVAKVAGSLENSDDALHVTGEAEAVVSHDQQLHD